jgi:hypothetical protein
MKHPTPVEPPDSTLEPTPAGRPAAEMAYEVYDRMDNVLCLVKQLATADGVRGTEVDSCLEGVAALLSTCVDLMAELRDTLDRAALAG